MTAISETGPAARATRIDWSPYLIGAGIGVLSWVVFVVVNNPLGITTALSQVCRWRRDADTRRRRGREKHLLGEKRIPA